MDAGPRRAVILVFTIPEVMNRSILVICLGFAAGLAQAQAPASDLVPRAAEARAAEAQVHRLQIHNGTVYHDGAALPEGALPAELDVDGMSMTFEYSGPVAPAIGLNGRIYTLEEGRLVELDQEEMDRQAFGFAKPQPLGRSAAEQAEHAYMQGLSERDRALYERLVREREMEAEAYRLAQQIRLSADPSLRSQLRDKLDAMFELKQENRREEIRQVEEVLQALRQRLQEREAMRDDIIQHRMRELTGQ